MALGFRNWRIEFRDRLAGDQCLGEGLALPEPRLGNRHVRVEFLQHRCGVVALGPDGRHLAQDESSMPTGLLHDLDSARGQVEV